MDISLLDVFWWIVYVISFLGSFSFGYLVLRFNIPDIRIVPREAKLGLSGIIGIGIFALSVGVTYLVNLNFLVFIPLWTVIFMGLFMIQQTVFSKKEMTVMLPVAKMEAPVFEERVEMRPRANLPRILEEKEVTEKGMIARPMMEDIRSGPIMPTEKPSERFTIKGMPEKQKLEVMPEVEKKQIERARKEYQEKTPEAAQAREPAQIRLSADRRSRYLARRGEMVEQVATDMERAVERREEKKEMESFERELESAPAKEISVEELSEGLDVEDLEKIGSIDELGELGVGELEDIGKWDLEELAGLASPEKVPRKKGVGCPKCASKNTTVVYCPYCGKGFCSNCSDKIERKGELVFYGCPVCKKEVIVRAEA
jgi:hypothetical protein